MTSSHGLLKSFLGVGAMYAFAMPIGLLSNIVLARTLGPATFGQFSFLLALLPLLALPASGGVAQLVTREVAVSSQASDWGTYLGVVRTFLYWVLCAGFLVIAGYFAVGPFTGLIDTDGRFALLWIVVLVVPILGLNAVLNGTIKGLGFPALAELPTQLVQPAALLAVFAILALIGRLDLESALLTQLSVTAATFGFATVLFLRIRPKEAINVEPVYRHRELFIALLPFSLIIVVGTLSTQVGIVLLGLLGADESVAFMRVGERGALLVALSLALVNMVISPHIVRLNAHQDVAGLQRLSRQSSRGAFAIAAAIAAILILFGKPLIGWTFGAEYVSGAYLPLVILAFGQLYSVAFGSVGILLAMCGFEKLTLAGQIAGLVATVFLAALLIPKYQAVGAAIAVSMGLFIWNSVMGYLVFRKLKIRPGIL